MSNPILNEVWKIHTETSTQKLVLVYLADRASHEGYCFPSRKRIAGACGLSLYGVTLQVCALERQGYISVKRPRVPGRGRANLYRMVLAHEQLNLDLAKVNGEIGNPVALSNIKKSPDRATPLALKGNPVAPNPHESKVKGFKALKSVTPGTALKGFQRLKASGVGNGERDALDRLFSLLSQDERIAYGANWRLRYRECADKFVRVVSDIESAIREGCQMLSVAAVADIRWREFQPRTVR